jgi:hypothetical protein
MGNVCSSKVSNRDANTGIMCPYGRNGCVVCKYAKGDLFVEYTEPLEDIEWDEGDHDFVEKVVMFNHPINSKYPRMEKVSTHLIIIVGVLAVVAGLSGIYPLAESSMGITCGIVLILFWTLTKNISKFPYKDGYSKYIR